MKILIYRIWFLATLMAIQIQSQAQQNILKGRAMVVTPSKVYYDSLNIGSKPTSNRVPYAGVFRKHFQTEARGRSDINAYLLAYLTTLVYPENLAIVDKSKKTSAQLHQESAFSKTYKEAVMSLFHSQNEILNAPNEIPEFTFVADDNRHGYDPEVMMISTREEIYLIFRGTDRVAKAESVGGYDFAEWLASDFDFGLQNPGYGIPGRVHKGFWNSLMRIGVLLGEKIVEKGGKSKKIWIAGHSLGAGHAQLFAAYLTREHKIQPQGLYLYSAPRGGDGDFAKYLEGSMKVGSIQRFDFIDDPVTALGPLPWNEPVGIRNYYNDIKTYQYNADERNGLDETRLLLSFIAGAGFATLDQLAGNIVKLKLGSGDFCFHNPEWILKAAYEQLSASEKEIVPKPLAINSTTLEGCNDASINKGKHNPSVVDIVKDVIETIDYNIKSILDNMNGMAVSAGNYYIKSARGGKYLGWDKLGTAIQNGSPVDVESKGGWKTDNKFKIEKNGYSYIVKSSGKLLDVRAETLASEYPKLQMWDFAGLFGTPGDNQRWFFFKIPGTSNKYIIRAAGITGRYKVLGYRNSCKGSNCRVRLEDGNNNDLSQVWILEKV